MDTIQARTEAVRPVHVAIIMDGNGRWARSRGLPRSAGHSRGGERYLQSEIAELHKNDVRLRVIGERSRLADDIVELIADAESLTAGNGGLNFIVALDYGGRREFVLAARRLAMAAAAGRLDPDSIGEEQFASALFTADIPDPDLIIRTSGERRLSNFLLWQSAYSELVFLDKIWPDFEKADLEAAILKYQNRQRRYGAVVEAI